MSIKKDSYTSIPLVSVILSTYNHKDYIKQCLDSILLQEANFDFEIVIGEDESVDGTREICLEYAERFPEKIRLFLRKREDVIFINGRPTGRFNVIANLKAAKGNYIAICEGDDYWTDPYKLQKQVNFMEKNKNCSLCHHSQLKLFGKNLIEDERSKELNDGDINDASDLFSFKVHPQTRTILFRNCLTAEDLKGDFLMQAIYGDFAICFLLAKYGQIGYLNENMAVYRIHEQGYAAKSLKKNEDYFISRLKLVEIWCKAFVFLNCNKSSFKKGILILYSSGVNKIGRRRSFRNVLAHWRKMDIETLLFMEIYFKLLLRIIIQPKWKS